jgi:hypothetical protein
MITFPQEFLAWRGIFNNSQMLGLSNGSLHDVLETTTSGKGNATVSAVGFNISCGYLSAKINSAVHSSDETKSGLNLTINGELAYLLVDLSMAPPSHHGTYLLKCCI